MNSKLVLLIALASLLVLSCRKQEIVDLGELQLQFSDDTIEFDTLFNTIGSVTKTLKAYNRNSDDINVSEIYLAGNGMSDFRLNINGLRSNSDRNVVIRAHDSIYLFIEITMDQGKNYIMERDSIVFKTGDFSQDVDLVAWGRDVVKSEGGVIGQDTSFNQTFPYIFFSSVYVSEGATLTLPPGTELYFQKGAGLYVDGTLIADGDAYTPVVLSGNRIEELYEDLPGQWDGVYLRSNTQNNILDYVEIRNAVTGLQVGDPDSFDDHPALQMTNCIIENVTYIGLNAWGADLTVVNSLISNCGFYAVKINGGGTCHFYHSTIANFYNYRSRFEPSLFLSNKADYNGNELIADLDFRYLNGIIWGFNQDELEIADPSPATANDYIFDYVVIKATKGQADTTDKTHFGVVYLNQEPGFVDYTVDNFQLDSSAFSRNKGNYGYASLYTWDFNQKNRLADALPDLGPYERTD
jgi:hypothetical protein